MMHYSLTCQCGAPKTKRKLTCRECWIQVPQHLRQAYLNASSDFQEQQAANQILNWLGKQPREAQA